MRVSILVPLPIVTAILLVGFAACSDQTGDEASGTGAGSPAADADLTGTVSEASKAAAREGGEAAGGESGEHAGEEREHAEDAEHGGSESGEHGGDESHDEHGSEGEEAGKYIGSGEGWDDTRRGARLILAFDPARSAFGGTVENTTLETLCAVRVEVHLSTGVELGPTERTDLAPGESVAVHLPSGKEPFASWTAHPEVSAFGP